MRMKSTTKLLLFSVLTTAVQFLCIHAFFPVMLTGDDYLAEISISGAYNGTGVSFYPFFNMLLIRGLELLYKLSPAIPWLAVTMELVLIVSCVVFQYSILFVSERNRIPLYAGELMYLCFFFISVFTVSLPLSFTLVSGIGGAAAVCLTLSAALTNRHLLSSSIVSILLLWISYALRPQSALIAICFWILSLAVFQVLRPLAAGGSGARKVKRIVTATVIFAVAFSGFFCIYRADRILRNTPNAVTVRRWNNARSAQIDFHQADYQTDSHFYNSIGWNEEFYNLEENWYLLDEKCDYSHYDAIRTYASDSSDSPRRSSRILSAVSATVKTLYSFATSIFYFPLFALLALLFLLCVCRGFQSWRRGGWLYCLFAVCALGGTALMWVYLTYIGRFVGHIFRLTCVPTISCLFLAILPQLRRPDRHAPRRLLPAASVAVFFLTVLMFPRPVHANKLILLIVTLLMAAVLFAVLLHYTGKKISRCCLATAVSAGIALAVMLSVFTTASTLFEFLDRQVKYISEQQYVADHTDSVFVSSRDYAPVQADLIYSICPDKTNLFYSIDFLLFSDAYDEKLEQAGLEELNIDSYFTDDVYFIGDSEDDETVSLLVDYMKTQYGDSVRAEVCDELDGGVAVYRFRK